MKPKRIPSPDELTMLEAMANPDPAAWDSWVKSQGLQPDPDLPVCLANIHPDQWIENSKVMPTPAIARYLESDDTLTTHTIDMMEIAIEKAYGMQSPWCVTSIRDGSEADGTLAVRYFYLLRE